MPRASTALITCALALFFPSRLSANVLQSCAPPSVTNQNEKSSDIAASHSQISAQGIRYNLSDHPKDYSCKISADGRFQRFEVRPGDHAFILDQKNGNERSEVVTADFRSLQQRLLFRSRQDGWIAFSFRVEPGLPILSRYAIVGQLHDVHDQREIGLSPPLCFVLDAAASDTIGYSLQTRSDPNPITLSQRPPVVRWKGTLTRGQWVRMVLHVQLDPFGRGMLQLWKDGVQQLSLTGISIGYNNLEDGAYWQYGIYRRENSNVLAVDYADVLQSTKPIDPHANQIQTPFR